MSVLQHSALTTCVIRIVLVIGWVLHSLEGKPRAQEASCEPGRSTVTAREQRRSQPATELRRR
jgi:hypothetical protein